MDSDLPNSPYDRLLHIGQVAALDPHQATLTSTSNFTSGLQVEDIIVQPVASSSSNVQANETLGQLGIHFNEAITLETPEQLSADLNTTADLAANMFVPPPFNKTTEKLDKDRIDNLIGGKLEIDKNGQLLIRYLEADGLVSDTIEGFDSFITDRIKYIIKSHRIPIIINENITNSSEYYGYGYIKLKFNRINTAGRNKEDANGNIIPGQFTYLYPRDARIMHSTYSFEVIINIKLYTDNGLQIPDVLLFDNWRSKMNNIPLLRIPAMLGSIADNLRVNPNDKSRLQLGECQFDPLGYFIIDGTEKVIMSQVRLRNNRLLIYKDTEDDVIVKFTSRTYKGQEIFTMYTDHDMTLRVNVYGLQYKNKGKVIKDSCMDNTIKYNTSITIAENNKNKKKVAKPSGRSGEQKAKRIISTISDVTDSSKTPDRKQKGLRTLNAFQLLRILFEGNKYVCDDMKVQSLLDQSDMAAGNSINPSKLIGYVLKFASTNQSDAINQRRLLAMWLQPSIKESTMFLSDVFNDAYNKMYMKLNDIKAAEKDKEDGRGKHSIKNKMPKRPAMTPTEFRNQYKTYDMLYSALSIHDLKYMSRKIIFDKQLEFIKNMINSLKISSETFVHINSPTINVPVEGLLGQANPFYDQIVQQTGIDAINNFVTNYEEKTVIDTNELDTNIASNINDFTSLINNLLEYYASISTTATTDNTNNTNINISSDSIEQLNKIKENLSATLSYDIILQKINNTAALIPPPVSQPAAPPVIDLSTPAPVVVDIFVQHRQYLANVLSNVNVAYENFYNKMKANFHEVRTQSEAIRTMFTNILQYYVQLREANDPTADILGYYSDHITNTINALGQNMHNYDETLDENVYIQILAKNFIIDDVDELKLRYIRIYEHMVEHLFSHIEYENPSINKISQILKSKGINIHGMSQAAKNLIFAQERQIYKNKIVRQKIDLLCLTIIRYVEVMSGITPQDDRDHLANQSFVNPSMMMEQLLRQVMDMKFISLSNRMKNQPNALSMFFKEINTIAEKMTDDMKHAFIPNKWGPPEMDRKQENITDILDRGESIIAQYAHLLRINIPTKRENKLADLRAVKASQLGYIDAVDTPSGGVVGLVTVRALTTRVSISRDERPIIKIIYDLLSNQYIDNPLKQLIMINSKPVAMGPMLDIYRELLALRRSLKIPYDVALVLEKGALNIFTDHGRPIRPLLIVSSEKYVDGKKVDNSGNVPIISELDMWQADFDDLLRVGAVEYVDPYELLKNKHVVAQSLTYLTFKRNDLLRNENIMINIIAIMNSILSDIMVPSEINRLVNLAKNGKFDEIVGLSALDDTLGKTIMELARRLENINIYVKRLRILKYTHMEIDPTATLGVISATIVLMDRNPGPRNNFQCGMAKQALGLNYSNPGLRFALNTKGLTYATPPILGTQMQKILGADDLPAGENIIVAIITTSDNEEDAITIKKEALENGLFNYMLTTSKNVILSNQGHLDKKTNPEDGSYIDWTYRIFKPTNELPGHKLKDYDNLDERGIIYPDSNVVKGDCLVCIIRTDMRVTKDKKIIGIERIVDCSLYVKKDEGGIVDNILISKTVKDELSITIRTRRFGIPVSGDKVATRQAQKSTIARIVAEKDLPFTKNGIVADIYLNPHALPKRMTIATILEIIVSKYGAMAGERVNGTIFRDFDLNSFMNILEDVYGYNPYGVETMINPVSGEEYPAQIMIGMTYYQLLKHQAHKKIQVRGGEGLRSAVTGQPVGGRKLGGGVRLGEQEVLALLAHGSASLIQDRLFHASDAYNTAFCTTCNRNASIQLGEDMPSCSICKGTSITKCKMSKTLKAGFEMISAMGVRTEVFSGDVPESIRQRRIEKSRLGFMSQIEAEAQSLKILQDRIAAGQAGEVGEGEEPVKGKGKGKKGKAIDEQEGSFFTAVRVMDEEDDEEDADNEDSGEDDEDREGATDEDEEEDEYAIVEDDEDAEGTPDEDDKYAVIGEDGEEEEGDEYGQGSDEYGDGEDEEEGEEDEDDEDEDDRFG